MNRISYYCTLILLLFFQYSFSQIVDPFSIRYQNQQKGGIVMLANVSVSCTNCATTTSQIPPAGNGQNNNVTMNYVDSDTDASTFMSTSDSLNLSNCSQVLWAGLYWSARVGKTGFTPSATTNYTIRNKIKLKVGTGAYQNLTADELLDNTVGHQTYHCFKNITSIVQSNNIKSRYTLANLVTRTGSSEFYGGWTIVVVYKNVYQPMRNLTVFDGLANVSSGNNVTIPINGFLTPLTGPVNFELGVVSHDGDRSQTGDQLQFNGVGTTYLNVSDALHPTNDVFNSTIARNAVLTPFRIPSFNNTLGHDASIFFPNNASFNYIGNNASSANVRIITGGETILTTVVTSVIDVFEPDLRATVYMQDLNGGTVNPGDVLEYTLVGKNIGSDVSTGTYMTDTLDIRTTYLPNSISVFYGPNTGFKTDAYLDDQAEYDPINRVVRVRIGNGANATTGGSVASSVAGTDSTVVKFRVTLVSDCMAFQCNSALLHKAYIFGNGNISGNAYNNGGLSDLLDANGCPTIANNVLAVNVVGCPPTVITANPPVCVGDLLTLSTPLSFGGVYSWTGPNGFSSTGQSTVNIPNVTAANAGQYSVVINFPSLNCIIDTTKTITILPNPAVQLSSSFNVSCFGGNNGVLSITNSGTGPFSYLWTNGNISSNPAGLVAGNYSVTVTDANTCFTTATYTITQPTALSGVTNAISDFNGFDINCFGSSTGIANVAASGGTSPYTYLWSNGSTSNSAINLPVGIANVTITDAHLCTTSVPVTLTQPASAVQTIVSSSNVSCFSGSNGSIDVTPSGGVSPYSYLWSNGATTQDLTNLSAGTYNLVTTDFNGCTKLNSVVITQPLAPVSLTQTHTNVLCYNQLTGSIDLSAAGGTSPYTYLWSNGAITQDLSGLSAGNYTVTVTDANLCISNLTVTITQPVQAIAAVSSITNIVCYGLTTGSIDITVSGGIAPYTYLWTNGAATQDISNLGTSTYGVTITDANLCVLNFNNLAVVLTTPAVQTSVASVNVSCYLGNNGSIDITTSGGVSPYSYLWSNGSPNQDISNLSAGTYNLVTTDNNGCIYSNSIVITEPSATITLSQTHQDVLCFNQLSGSIDITPIAGTAPYSYSWSNGSTMEDLGNIGAGNYSVIVTDANSCTASLGVVISQPLQQITVSSSISNVACFQTSTGAIDLTVVGGTGPYTYSWSNANTLEDLINLPANTYSVDITDQNGCSISYTNLVVSQPNSAITNAYTAQNISCFGLNDGQIDIQISGGLAPYAYTWSNGAQTEDLTNVISGSYFVVVEDSYNCIEIFEYAISQPAQINTSYTVLEPSCFGYFDGEINTTTSGGTMPYSLNWNNGASTSLLQSIGAGNYTQEITDANGCLNETPITLDQPAQIQVTLDADVFAGCNPLLVNFVNNSDELFLSNWYFGDVSVGTGTQIPHTYTSAGSYDVTLVITDANGCSNFAEFVSLINVLPTPIAGINVSSTYLNAAEPEVIILNTSEGATSYVWNLGDSLVNHAYYEPGDYTYPVYNQDDYLITLIAVGANGCADSTEVLIEFDNRLIIYVPNSFTPNRDEFNNSFKPVVPIPLKNYQFTIYNRWGELIFESFDKEEGWDGTFNGQMVQEGTYSWKMVISTSKVDGLIKNGNVNLFR